ncbi:MAG: hypothetical protein GX446_06735 [Chthonomonadales bacterium]|nr:hypothetical protein [Chthonomonadales bacterium]
MTSQYPSLPRGNVRLLPGILQQRYDLNRAYVASLTVENLLQSFYAEAGLHQWYMRNSSHGMRGEGTERHWGWESPTCQVRGHFLGHWLSACAQMWAARGDLELKARADRAVDELAVCQEKNGGEWCSPIPEKYMYWTAAGKPTWAPHYVHHKTLMGLTHMAVFAGSARALDIAGRLADWFHRWTGQFDRKQMDDILDVETGGMLEAWADLYGVTGEEKYLDLVERYRRGRLFDPLLDGRDMLTNRHANTTIPEAHGAARCYEVTGDPKWRAIVEAYWDCAVTRRGYYCTGAQTNDEAWTPPFSLAERRGAWAQEHCTVYNMIRLAEYLYRWTGDSVYADYIERNLYNGILAQQNPQTGMISYYLSMRPGDHKKWGHPTFDFWCCHGTLVQAHAMHDTLLCHADAEGLRVDQYFPFAAEFTIGDVPVTVRLEPVFRGWTVGEPTGEGYPWVHEMHRPKSWTFKAEVRARRPVEFTLSLRRPGWMTGPMLTWVGTEGPRASEPGAGYESIRRRWSSDTVFIELPIGLRAEPLPDEPTTVAFLHGPVVLAGLCDCERGLVGDPARPTDLLRPNADGDQYPWGTAYRTIGQVTGTRFIPLYNVVDEPYSLYFPIVPRA